MNGEDKFEFSLVLKAGDILNISCFFIHLNFNFKKFESAFSIG